MLADFFKVSLTLSATEMNAVYAVGIVTFGFIAVAAIFAFRRKR
jgi:hypothetical protein